TLGDVEPFDDDSAVEQPPGGRSSDEKAGRVLRRAARGRRPVAVQGKPDVAHIARGRSCDEELVLDVAEWREAEGGRIERRRSGRGDRPRGRRNGDTATNRCGNRQAQQS